MRSSFLAVVALSLGLAAAKQCMNMTVPVTTSARTGIFDITVPQTNFDVATFISNLTQQGRNFTDAALTGYATTSGTYNISTQSCTPTNDNATHPTVQVLTHGIGFDKGYWDSPYNNFNYSYVDVATDQYGYCTLAIDRLGVGNSSHGEPLNEIQASLEVAVLAELTLILRNGLFPGVNQAFQKITHVGHSFGAAQTYSLVNMFPDISDGIVLTGFSMNLSFVGLFQAGSNFVQANKNQPFRFGSVEYAAAQDLLNMYSLTNYVAGLSALGGLDYSNGYLTNANTNTNQYVFFLPGFFDPGALLAGENSKQPVTVGELLTLGSVPMMNSYSGPVMVFTGSNDLPFCGGDCLATGDPSIPSIPSTVAMNFPNAQDNFTAYIQPKTGHGLNFHYNATSGYNVINQYLDSKGLKSS